MAALLRMAPPPVTPDFSDEVTGRLDDANRIAALHQSLHRLRPNEFEVLALCAWSDLSYAEAAEALGVPVGTVRSRLFRARAKLLKATERELRKSSREPTDQARPGYGRNRTGGPVLRGGMTVSDDRAQIRARFPAPADRDLPLGRHLLHRENLMSQILNEPPGSQPGGSEPPRDRRPSPRSSRAWHPSARGLAAAAAAVALVAGLGVAAAAGFRPTRPRLPATAPRLRSSTGSPSWRPPGQRSRSDRTSTSMSRPRSRARPPSSRAEGVEGWIAQSQSKQTLWRDSGHSETPQAGTTSSGFGGPIIGLTMSAPPSFVSRDKLLYPTYAYLESLPASPRQLLNLIQRQVSPDGRSDVEAFLAIGQLLSTAVLPRRSGSTVPGGGADPRSNGCSRCDGCARLARYRHRLQLCRRQRRLPPPRRMDLLHVHVQVPRGAHQPRQLPRPTRSRRPAHPPCWPAGSRTAPAAIPTLIK